MSYIGKSPSGTGVRSRFYFTQSSGGGTSISGTDDSNKTLTFTDGEYIDVYLNGVLLVAGTDYNTNTANTISGLAALANGDVVEVVVYDIFTVADTVSSLNGGTFSGNVVFSGTTTGLDLNGTELILDADADTSITADTDDQIDFKVGGSDKVTIDSTGVGIGNSSPSHLLDATVSSGSATARFGTTHNSGDNDGTVIISSGGSGDAMLRFDYEGSNTDRARLGTTSSGQDLKFFTAGNNERMQINSNGEIIFQKPNNQFATLTIRGADTNGYYNVLFEGSSSNGYKVLFKHGTSSVGSIITTSSATSYNTSSDHRLKDNVADMSGAIARVKQLSPKRFSWIVDDLDDANVDGFLAHEAQTVVPEAVTGTHNEVDDDGNAVMQGIDQSKLVPLLTGALKEAIAKIETLETKVAALEAAE